MVYKVDMPTELLRQTKKGVREETEAPAGDKGKRKGESHIRVQRDLDFL